MGNGKTPTYKDIYELIDTRTTKIDDKVQHLADRFDNLEAGRLSALETQLANLKGKLAVWGVLGGIVIATISSIVASILAKK